MSGCVGEPNEYDVFDRRMSKQVDDNGNGTFDRSEQFVYDGEDIALRFVDPDGDGSQASSLANRYLHGPEVDQVFADEQFDATGQLTNVIWPLADDLGTTRDLANNLGVIVNHRVFDAFGRITGETDPTIDHAYAFTGREWDGDAQLYYYRARWYDAAVGRFISEDPIGFAAGDTNISRYVANSPTNATDPSGLTSEGHHWTPINVIAKLFEQGILSEAEYKYFAGRMSGPLSPGNPNVGYTDEHRCYDAAVEEELRRWKGAENSEDYTRKMVADNLKAGKTWDGKRTNKVINDFNKKVHKHTLNKNFDALKDEAKVSDRGESSLRGRGKLLAIIGAIGGLTEFGDKIAQGGEIARILTKGEGICDAMDAAKRGDHAKVMVAMIEVGNGRRSVFEELLDENPGFAIFFRKAVEAALADD